LSTFETRTNTSAKIATFFRLWRRSFRLLKLLHVKLLGLVNKRVGLVWRKKFYLLLNLTDEVFLFAREAYLGYA
jgi:hypothetical protein